MGDFPFRDPSEARYEGPTLFIRGTKSRYVPDDVLPLIGQFFPRFELTDVNCGHWVISEKPEPFRQGNDSLCAIVGHTDLFSRCRVSAKSSCPRMISCFMTSLMTACTEWVEPGLS